MSMILIFSLTPPYSGHILVSEVKQFVHVIAIQKLSLENVT